MGSKSQMTTSHTDGIEQTVRWERCVLGALLENPGKWSEASSLTSDDFCLRDHSKIFAAMSRLHEHKCEADSASVYAELGDSVSAEYLSDLIDGIVKPNLPQYVRRVRKAARDRDIVRLLASAQNPEDRASLLAKLQALQESPNGRDSQLIVIRGDEVAEKPLRWIWKPYLPLGKLVHFGGNSSQAKSPITVDLAARISLRLIGLMAALTP
jgi:DnaB-like helicase N terminal domain